MLRYVYFLDLGTRHLHTIQDGYHITERNNPDYLRGDERLISLSGGRNGSSAADSLTSSTGVLQPIKESETSRRTGVEGVPPTDT